jgi:NAD(P)-dependent dehydrogenase (short-subunit alcohol dehydrogenase family)
MVERGIKGSIICIISTAGWQGQKDNIGYCTSKSGLINFVRAAAMDLAPYGIRINSYTPTATQADNPELIAARRAAAAARDTSPPAAPADGGPAPVRLDFQGMSPMKAQPTPTDHGHMIAFLCSDFARMVTGADFRADGGVLAKYWPYVPVDSTGPLPLLPMDVTGEA